MPQLDPNSFVYQYFGILFSLIIIYVLLSYVVLPIVLRVLLIRKYFSQLNSSSLNLLNTSSLVAVFNNKDKNIFLIKNNLNNYFSLLSSALISVLVVLSNFFTKNSKGLLSDNKLGINFINIYNSYVLMLLLIDNQE